MWTLVESMRHNWRTHWFDVALWSWRQRCFNRTKHATPRHLKWTLSITSRRNDITSLPRVRMGDCLCILPKQTVVYFKMSLARRQGARCNNSSTTMSGIHCWFCDTIINIKWQIALGASTTSWHAALADELDLASCQSPWFQDRSQNISVLHRTHFLDRNWWWELRSVSRSYWQFL